MKSVSDQMRFAAAAFARGDMAGARAQAEAALRTQPHNAAILQFLGVVSCEAGDVERGCGYFRDAIAHGDNADRRVNLAKALASLGQFEEAAALCEGPIATASPALQRMKADILKAQGRADDALWAYEALALHNPQDFESWNNLGNARHDLGDFEGALAALRQAQALEPQSSLVHVNIARVLASMDRHADACLTMEKAALLAPQDPAPLLELGQMLTSIDHPTEALRALGAAARLDPKDARIFSAMGLAFTDLSDQAKAEQAYRLALRAAPASAVSYLDLGILLEKANRLDELDQLIQRAERMRAVGPEIDYLRALLLNRNGAIAEALELVRTVRSEAIHPATLAQFIGQLADRLDRTDEAFDAFEEMNRLMAQTPLGVGADRSAYRRGIDGVAAQTTAEWFSSWREIPAARPGPAFLVGFPRSGTTLLDTMLMGHSDAHVLEEIPILEKLAEGIGGFARIAELEAAEVAALRARYFEEAHKASPAPPGNLIIDKNPLSMIRIPLIHRLFPDARIIFAMRHPCDVVLSCYMQNFKPTEAMSSFLDLENAARTYDRIFAYWEKCRDIFPIHVHMIRYEDMVRDAEGTLRRVVEFLGLPWEEAVLAHQATAAARGHIRTPSYAQVTEKVYQRARGRWERYAVQMRPILPILEPWVRRYGYGSLLGPDSV